ncbi:MFS transporter [Kineococcus rubinsiae]|uniref:MFS transporter n=1 Tax=Kineococcus rubinsiae TaxID=2609562 RepID=UPI001430A3E4|nr:MFS transporter [Kineococcus rubinsiae]NIZ89712.1 MFS transporter [Kineococcus rubinsiae]
MSSSSPAAAPATSAPHHGPQPGLVVGILALAGISVSLMQTLVIPIVGQLPVLLGSTPTNTAWAITATLLAGAVVTPIAGRLGDMLGKRPVLLASLAVMVAGSVVCAFADSLLPMIVGRGLQGFAAGVIPLGISLMRDVLPAEKLGPATALMSASLGVGGALGLPAAALIADNADWHALFWVAAGLGTVVLVLIAALIPAPRGAARPAARFDVPGAIGLSAALVALLLGVSKGKDWGWTSATTLGLLAAAVVLAIAWGAWELRTAHPLVDLRTVARRQVLLTNVASLVFGYAMFGMSLALPQIIQLPAATGYGLGESMLVAGLAMVPGGLVMMVTAGASAKVTRAHGPKVSLMIGAVVVAAGYVLGAVFMDAVWQLSVVSGVIGAGIGFAYGAMPALIMSAVPASETASANSFNTLVRSVGSSVSSAVAGAVLAASATTLGTVTVPSQDGFRTVLLVAAGAALVALVVAAFLPRRTATAQPAAPLATPDPASPTTGSPTGAAVPGPRVRHSTAGDAPAATAPGVRGTVSAAGARPLPGAVVTVTDAAGRQVSRTTTGPDGRFELAVPTGGTYLLITAAPQLAPHATLVAVADRPVTQDVRLAGRSTVTGRVLAPTAQDPADTVPVVPGALVSLTDATGHVVATSTTDGSGTYEFSSLAGGAYVLAAQATRHRPTAVGVDLGDDSASTLDLVLTPGAHLAGTVTAGPGQQPLADAVVTLVDEDGQVVARATTGGDGGYRFADLPDGEYVLTAASYAPTTRRVSLAGGRVHATDVHLGAEPADVPADVPATA